MRYKYSDFAPSNKRQYFLAVGVKDLYVLKGLTEKALRSFPHMPQNPEMLDVEHRLGSMNKALKEAILAAEELNDEGSRKKLKKSS